MKFIERILVFCIIALMAAYVINGLAERPRSSKSAETETLAEKNSDAARIFVIKETATATEPEKPIESFYKTPADDMHDPMREVVFNAGDELSMMRSLADMKNYLPADKYEKVLAVLKGKHKISSDQSENGKLELRFPSLLVLKAYDGKNAAQILESAEK